MYSSTLAIFTTADGPVYNYNFDGNSAKSEYCGVLIHDCLILIKYICIYIRKIYIIYKTV